MTPSDQQQLKAHLKAAAEILYRNIEPTELKSFETREKSGEHVKFARDRVRGEEGELMSRKAFGNLRVKQAHSVHSIRDNRVSSRKSRADEL